MNNEKREYVTWNGMRSEVVQKILAEGEQRVKDCQPSKEEVERLLDLILERTQILSDDEEVECQSFDKEESGVKSGFLAEDLHLYISIRKTTLALLACLVPSVIPFELLLAFLGVSLEGAFFKRLNEWEGELCILSEGIACGNKGADKKLLRNFRGECVNCQYRCKYRKEDACICKPEDVGEILEALWEDGILEKRHQKYYCRT